MKIKGVHGVSLGRKLIAGQLTQTVCITIHVTEKLPPHELATSDVIPKEIEGVPTDVIEHPPIKWQQVSTPEPDAYSDADNRTYMPLKGGCMIADSTGVGTNALIVLGPTGKPAILSCRHVIPGGDVHQPNPNSPVVADSVVAGGNLDCALAYLRDGIEWTNWILEIGPIEGAYDIQTQDLPYSIRKRGATTGLTSGTVTDLAYSGISEEGIEFSSAMRIVADPTDSTFAEAGDSGAAIIDDQNRIVGIFQGSSTNNSFVAIPIGGIIDQLNISIISNSNVRLLMCLEKQGDTPGTGDNLLWSSWADEFEFSSGLARIPVPFRQEAISGNLNLIAYKTNNAQAYVAKQVTEQVYCLYNRGGVLHWCIFDGQTWGVELSHPSVKLLGEPKAIEFKGTLYCFYIDAASGELSYITMNSQQTWGTPVGLGFQAHEAPGLANYEDHITGVFRSPNSNVLNIFGFNGRTINTVPMRTKSGAQATAFTGVGLKTFNGQLWCMKAGAAQQLSYNVFDGASWSDDAIVNMQPMPAVTFRPEIHVLFGNLFCGYGNQSSATYFATTGDGRSWDLLYIDDYSPLGTPSCCLFPTRSVVLAPQTNNAGQMYAAIDGKLYVTDLASNGWSRVNGAPEPLSYISIENSDDSHIFALDKNLDYWAKGLPNGIWVKNWPQPPQKTMKSLNAMSGPGPREIYGLDLNFQSWAISLPAGGNWAKAPMPYAYDYAFLDIAPPISNANVFFASGADTLLHSYRYDDKMWATDWPSPCPTAPKLLAIADGSPPLLIVGDTWNNLFSIEVRNNARWNDLWPPRPPAKLMRIGAYGAPINRLFGVDNGGTIFSIAFGSSQWEIRWPSPLPPPVST